MGNYFKKKKNDIDILNHIDIIINLQKILMGYHSVEKNSILSEIGRRVDRIFVMTKKLDIGFNELNYYEKCVLDKVKKQLKRIEDIDYIDIYRRGMYKDEICIERVDESNLRVVDQVEIGKIKKINFNIVEEDFINYLFKYKKKCNKDALREYAKEYVRRSNLKKSSLQYINLIVDMPCESLKYWYKNRYEWDEHSRDEFRLISDRELEF
ncbi:hypothetical protein K5V21_09575 [Clostridium sardiniense]|uniref:Spore coat protein n=1 Tax=Clostridium sardiniense TaxID=29369 RepID=A0ABS7KY26_CLOSR|nr:hypothetical protein [Clostridium sardiniense]MBY0755709.1 hypothetical protein [Clostridium sardiniense]